MLKWHRAGLITPELITPELITPELITPELITPELITPELITPGNHLRWDADQVHAQLRARRQRDE